MQKDFHYYCIGVLARAAGFSSEDALNEKDFDWNGFFKSYKRLNNFKMNDWFFYTLFCHFHKAALLQRHFVLERLP
jgi:hypothetical protein